MFASSTQLRPAAMMLKWRESERRGQTWLRPLGRCRMMLFAAISADLLVNPEDKLTALVCCGWHCGTKAIPTARL